MDGISSALINKTGIIPFLESLAYAPDQVDHSEGKSPDSSQELTLDTEYGQLHGIHLKSFKRKALILHFHGSGYNITKHSGHVDWLPAIGYDVVMFDYPGYGKSEGVPTRTSVERSSSEWLQYFAKKHHNLPIFLFGQSLGGAIALSSYIQNSPPKNIRGIIIDSTFSSYSRMARLKLKRKGLLYKYLSEFLPRFLSTDYDPITTISKINLPVLMLHSKTDSVVPFEEACLLLKESASEIDFWVQVGPDHTGVFRPGFQDYREKLDRWILSKLVDPA